MQQRFEWSSTGAIARLATLLAALLVTPAKAGEVAVPQDLDGGASAQRCVAPGDVCPHIRGYIKAGSDFSSRNADGQTPPRIAAPPILTGVRALGQATADALNRGLFFLEASHDERAR